MQVHKHEFDGKWMRVCTRRNIEMQITVTVWEGARRCQKSMGGSWYLNFLPPYRLSYRGTFDPPASLSVGIPRLSTRPLPASQNATVRVLIYR